MASVDLLISGFPANSNYGYCGYSAVALMCAGKKKILFDTGAYGMRLVVLEKLKSRGLGPDDITDIVLSHIHWDHSHNVPVFKNARIYLHEAEIEYAKKGNDLMNPEGLMSVIEESGRLTVFHDEFEIAKDVQVIVTAGHTPGHCSLMVTGEETTILAADALNIRQEYFTQRSRTALDPVGFAASCKRISEIQGIMIPGHDRPFRIANDTVEYLQNGELEIYVNCTQKPEDTFTYSIKVG